MQNITPAPDNRHPDDDVPADLDPAINPIICLHWFGHDPVDLAARRQHQHLARHVHREPGLVRAVGGDRWPEPPLHVVGGRK